MVQQSFSERATSGVRSSRPMNHPWNPSARLARLAGTTVALMGFVACAWSDVTPSAGMLRWPDVSKDRIVFSYANDLWTVAKNGGVASPLASPPGQESFPRFSADGATIAFVGNYDGNRDLYTMPVEGGVPLRITYHPAGETLSDWTPDGKLLFLSNGLAGLGRQSQMFTTSVAGGLPTRVNVPYAGFGAISPDGQWLAYSLHSTDTRTWKRYRGGMATDLWLFNLTTNQSKRVTDWEGTDTLPMWIPGGDGKTLYYLSDQGDEHRLNLWAYDVATGTSTRITAYKDDDIRWPSVGPGEKGEGEIVFQLGDKLILLNLGSRQAREVSVTIPGARPKIRQRTVDASNNVNAATISPGGKRVAIEARGELWSAPAKEGVVRNLTRTPGVAERDPAWSPDGSMIAYFSDVSGEYELWVRPSDAKPPEKKDEKKDEKKEGEKAGDAAPDAVKEAAKPDSAKPDSATTDDAKQAEPNVAETKVVRLTEPKKLSSLGAGFRFNPTWSPDAKKIAFCDNNGRIFVSDVAAATTSELDKDPWMNQQNFSWSNDSVWLAYTRGGDENENYAVWLANTKTGEKHQVTSWMFNASSPTFDRKGDWLFFVSRRSVTEPVYGDLDTTFVYRNGEQVLMVPLRKDVKSPWLAKSDEETLKDEKPPEKKDGKKDESKQDDAKKDASSSEDKKSAAPAEATKEDAITGTWSASAELPNPPQGMPPRITFTLTLRLKGTEVSGQLVSPMGSSSITGTFESGKLSITTTMMSATVTMTGAVSGDDLSGEWSAPNQSGAWTAKRTSKDAGDAESSGSQQAGDAKGGSKDAAKEVKIDLEGFERRAIVLPITPGAFGVMAVADGEKLIFVRQSARGATEPAAVKMYEWNADEKEEKKVVDGGSFQLSGDAKKLLVFRGGKNAVIVDASAGGGKSLTVPTDGMDLKVDPRTEWNQIFTDAWRIMRDYFYEPTMHGVDWARMRQHYGAMLADAASREDVNWIISEMISELNIGHAYLGNPGDVENAPTVGVGLLGCDYELVSEDGVTAYRIAKIIEGAPWDSDARGPLSQPGVDVKVGDFLLEVDGEPVSTSKDPWAAFVGTAGRVVSLTVSAKPTKDGSERTVLVKPEGSESNLRYRAWIERNRAYVAEKSEGKIGYIYVPNTGVDGQNDLFRQFFGQKEKPALIIDERWNGGGQIPTRFIELLNRPVTNYWAKRDGTDWTWPPDSAQGHMAMLVNGLAGSGGDMFPWLFKHNKLGPVIGTRTWGGLVGISGNPGFVDGGNVTVPTFGFYESDGTWGVEGHGVDPDIEVIDDPALMINGGDPQLDRAIAEMQQAITQRPYTRPKRPTSPNRSGMGLPTQDR
jgi:tricorn protease